MRALWTLALLTAGLTALWAPWAAADGGAVTGLPPQAGTTAAGAATATQPQEVVKTNAQMQMKRRLLDSAVKPSPRDPFMFGAPTLVVFAVDWNAANVVECGAAVDNHLVGDVSVRSHPVYGSASLSVRSGKVYRNIDSVKSPGALAGATSVPTANDVRFVGCAGSEIGRFLRVATKPCTCTMMTGRM
jgi:hypothetical protein